MGARTPPLNLFTMGYRDNYTWTITDWIRYHEKFYSHALRVKRAAANSARTYANLFTRDMRKILITNKSECAYCSSKDKLVVDHFVPIMKGGRNLPENCQILCSKCNRAKSDRFYLSEIAGA